MSDPDSNFSESDAISQSQDLASQILVNRNMYYIRRDCVSKRIMDALSISRSRLHALLLFFMELTTAVKLLVITLTRMTSVT